MAQTPSGRLLRRSAHEEDRPALFAAQFALSHACWLITYPLAGWLGARAGLEWSFGVLGALACAATLLAGRLWPATEAQVLEHRHDDLPADHAHLASVSDGDAAAARHAHPYVVDDEHRRWPG